MGSALATQHFRMSSKGCPLKVFHCFLIADTQIFSDTLSKVDNLVRTKATFLHGRPAGIRIRGSIASFHSSVQTPGR